MGHHFLVFFFFFKFGKKVHVICINVIKETFLLLTTVTLYPAKRVIAGNQWDAQLTSTGQIFQAAAMLAGLPAMLASHIGAKWFWENVGSDAIDK